MRGFSWLSLIHFPLSASAETAAFNSLFPAEGEPMKKVPEQPIEKTRKKLLWVILM